MNSRVQIAAGARLATIAVAAPAASRAAAPHKSCPDSFGPQGQAGGDFYRDIRVRNVTCPTARAVIEGVRRQAQEGHDVPRRRPSSSASPASATASIARTATA